MQLIMKIQQPHVLESIFSNIFYDIMIIIFSMKATLINNKQTVQSICFPGTVASALSDKYLCEYACNLAMRKHTYAFNLCMF